MTPIDDNTTSAERARVSVIERFLPLFSYSVAGLGGAISGYFVYQSMIMIQDTANSGIGAFARALTTGMWSLTASLVLALVIGFVAIIVQGGMLFANRKTASPSPLLIFPVALIAMLPIAISWLALQHILVATISQTGTSADLIGPSQTSAIAAMALGFLTPVLGLILSFFPFMGRLGRCDGAFVLVVLVELIMLMTFVYLSWQISSITKMVGRY